ncbi:hypothetical protein [Kitasatospora sp. NPDC098663]|uniref:hypothetical protein n=1 Tax=Kitasatospora sp. NPDC098663 TaxID=3364096 RepID=UPI003807D1F5
MGTDSLQGLSGAYVTTKNAENAISPFAVHPEGFFVFDGVQVNPIFDHTESVWKFSPALLHTPQGDQKVSGRISLNKGVDPTFEADLKVGEEESQLRFAGSLSFAYDAPIPHGSTSAVASVTDPATAATPDLISPCQYARAKTAYLMTAGMIAASGIGSLAAWGEVKTGWVALLGLDAWLSARIEEVTEYILKHPAETFTATTMAMNIATVSWQQSPYFRDFAQKAFAYLIVPQGISWLAGWMGRLHSATTADAAQWVVSVGMWQRSLFAAVLEQQQICSGVQ